MARLPSGSFAANSAWLVCAAIAFNLTRAAGCLASSFRASNEFPAFLKHLARAYPDDGSCQGCTW